MAGTASAWEAVEEATGAWNKWCGRIQEYTLLDDKGGHVRSAVTRILYNYARMIRLSADLRSKGGVLDEGEGADEDEESRICGVGVPLQFCAILYLHDGVVYYCRHGEHFIGDLKDTRSHRTKRILFLIVGYVSKPVLLRPG